MLRSYLTAALRHARRHPGAAIINVAGLTLGLAVCLVVGLYVAHERSYDRFHPEADRLFRVVTGDAAVPEGAPLEARTCCARGQDGVVGGAPGLAPVVTERVAGIERAVTVGRPVRLLVGVGERRLYVDDVVRAGPAFFDVLGGFDLVRGDPSTALAEPRQAVLTPALARRLFGTDADPVGRTFTLDNDATYTVTGLAAAPPSTSHVQFQMLRSLSPAERGWLYGDTINWRYYGDAIYLRLTEGTAPAVAAAQMQAIERAGRAEGEAHLLLQSVPDVHLHSGALANDYAKSSDVRYLYFFGAVGLAVLVLALVNYVNLATARAATRGREVGVRKTAGASRGQLVGQFLGEAVLTAFAALPLALAVARLALPLVNDVAGLRLALAPALAPGVLAALALGVGAAGLLAGAYPALVLARQRPASVLAAAGRTTSGGGARLRQGLVVVQLAATVALVAATLVVWQQLEFVRTQRLGFDEERVVTFDVDPLEDDYNAFKARLAQHPAIEGVSSGPPPGLSRMNLRRPVKDDAGETIAHLAGLEVDYGYVETLGLRLEAGRAFDARRADSTGVLLTPSAVRAFGLEGDPLGQSVEIMDGHVLPVVGVVGAFHNASMHQPKEPTALILDPGNNYTGLARLAAGRVPEGLAALEAAWAEVAPARPFTFAFLDERIEAQYRSERRLATLFGGFAALALAIAGLGLVGMVAFAVRRRQKEIGIRKALGATAAQVAGLLASGLVRLVAVAVAVGAPLAYLGLARWLGTFAYHIDLGPGLFLAAGGLTLAVALAVAAAHTLRAARLDPADVLRSE